MINLILTIISTLIMAIAMLVLTVNPQKISEKDKLIALVVNSVILLTIISNYLAIGG